MSSEMLLSLTLSSDTTHGSSVRASDPIPGPDSHAASPLPAEPPDPSIVIS